MKKYSQFSPWLVIDGVEWSNVCLGCFFSILIKSTNFWADVSSMNSEPSCEEKGHERLAALQSVNHKASSNGHFCEPAACFMAALLAGWIKDIKVNFNIGPLTPTRRRYLWCSTRSQGGRAELDILAVRYCVASSCLIFCVHDIPLKLIRRFELFSYLIQFVTGCKPGSVFTNKQQVPVWI